MKKSSFHESPAILKFFFSALRAGVLPAIMLLIFSAMPAQANECDGQYANGIRPQIINPTMRQKDYTVCSPNGFEAMSWGLSRTALWSAEWLSAERVSQGRQITRVDSFHAEDSIPPADRAELADYRRSGYDRGHMAPNKDMGDTITQGACFTLANMIPQNPQNNRNIWEGIEEAVRSYALDHGGVFVITGPIFPGHGQQAEWLNGRVLIPVALYKIVYDPHTGKAAAYYTDNSGDQRWAEKGVAEIEAMTQINFFPWMSTEQKTTPGWILPTPTPHGHGGEGEKHHSHGHSRWHRSEPW